VNLPKEKGTTFIFGIVVQSQAQKGEVNCWKICLWYNETNFFLKIKKNKITHNDCA
jgi:hypothetical protein